MVCIMLESISKVAVWVSKVSFLTLLVWTGVEMMPVNMAVSIGAYVAAAVVLAIMAKARYSHPEQWFSIAMLYVVVYSWINGIGGHAELFWISIVGLVANMVIATILLAKRWRNREM